MYGRGDEGAFSRYSSSRVKLEASAGTTAARRVRASILQKQPSWWLATDNVFCNRTI